MNSNFNNTWTRQNFRLIAVWEIDSTVLVRYGTGNFESPYFKFMKFKKKEVPYDRYSLVVKSVLNLLSAVHFLSMKILREWFLGKKIEITLI